MAVVESFDQIDTAAVDELIRINQEREVLRDRLAKVEERRDKVSGEVVQRVSRDYQAQISALDQEAKGPLSRSRQEYAKLVELYDEVQAALDEAALDKEELELRSEIGEFEPQEFRKRMSGCRKKLQQKQAEIEAGDALKSKFAAAFPADEEPPPSPGGLDAVPPVDDVTREVEAPPEVRGEAVASGATVLLSKEGIKALTADLEAASPEEAGDRMAPPAPPPPEGPGGSTVILRRAKLVVAAEGQAGKEYPLGLEGTLLGSSSECDVVLENAAISARHLELSFGAGGYTLRDLGSGIGTLVNGEKVEQKALQDGDQIQVGDFEFHFRLV